jgi:Mg2+ and Co2+ transporter CorA
VIDPLRDLAYTSANRNVKPTRGSVGSFAPAVKAARTIACHGRLGSCPQERIQKNQVLCKLTDLISSSLLVPTLIMSLFSVSIDLSLLYATRFCSYPCAMLGMVCVASYSCSIAKQMV